MKTHFIEIYYISYTYFICVWKARKRKTRGRKKGKEHTEPEVTAIQTSNLHVTNIKVSQALRSCFWEV